MGSGSSAGSVFTADLGSWITCHSVLRAFGALLGVRPVHAQGEHEQELMYTCDAFLSGPLSTVFSTLPAPRSPGKARAAVPPLCTPSVAERWEKSENRTAEAAASRRGRETTQPAQGAFSTLSFRGSLSASQAREGGLALEQFLLALGMQFQDLCCL